jgi:alkanesulfonate monooxygenase SsuD/methylene tetrahydromethanopterin reductase-like flavin-dependent oxidoreductase (luciferase family)
VESTGFDVLTFADHLVPAMPPFTGTTAAAMVTERPHVGTLVPNDDFRHPVKTARKSAGAAAVSDGRFELGLGAGHLKSEYDAAGIPFDRGGVRGGRLEESAGTIRALLDGDAADVEGAHYRVYAQAQAPLPATPASGADADGGKRRAGAAVGGPTSPTSPTTTTPPATGSTRSNSTR